MQLYIIILTQTIMEKHSFSTLKFIDYNILQFNDQGKAMRLWHLFCEKILDIFLRDCEILMQSGFNLSALSRLKQYPNDFKIEYESMKKAFVLGTQDINLSKSSDQGWKVIDIDDKCTISVRSKGTLLQLKSKGTVDLNIKHICYAAYMIKHYTECIPFCKQAKDLLQPSRVQKVGFLRLSLPIPLIKDRSVLVRGVGYRLSHLPENIYVFAEGLNDDKQYLQRIKIDPKKYMEGRQLLDLKHCAIQMKCLGPKLIQFSAAATVDHHISFAPQTLVVFIVKQLGKFILNSLFEKLRNFQSTIWAKQLKQRYDENRGFYEWIDSIVDQCLLANKPQK